jgi:hypothetical protein
LSLTIKNSRELLTPENLKLKILVVAPPGFGKTTFAGTAPNPGFAACETGQGSGILPIARMGIDYFEPDTYTELVEFCRGKVFPTKETYVADSATDMVPRFIKAEALTVSRGRGNSDKRAKGVPELDDFMVMGELLRQSLVMLIGQPKHIVVTAKLRGYQPAVIDPDNPKNNRAEKMGGPDLPGQMSVASTGMFDIVLLGKSKTVLDNPADAKSKRVVRYWQTYPTEQYIAKCRLVSEPGISLLDAEEIWDPQKGLGTFPYIFEKAIRKLKEAK